MVQLAFYSILSVFSEIRGRLAENEIKSTDFEHFLYAAFTETSLLGNKSDTIDTSGIEFLF